MPVRTRNSSPARCGVVPTPAEPKLTPLGFIFAQPTNSSTVLDGWLADTTNALQFSQILDT